MKASTEVSLLVAGTVLLLAVVWIAGASAAGVEESSPVASPSISAQLRTGEQVEIQRACGHITRVKITDTKGSQLFLLAEDESLTTARDCR